MLAQAAPGGVADDIYKTLVLGYLSGASLWSGGTPDSSRARDKLSDWLANTPVDLLTLWAQNYCRSHPTEERSSRCPR
jgi:hypothetical protein